jgi:hypothetical protein
MGDGRDFHGAVFWEHLSHARAPVKTHGSIWFLLAQSEHVATFMHRDQNGGQGAHETRQVIAHENTDVVHNLLPDLQRCKMNASAIAPLSFHDQCSNGVSRPRAGKDSTMF